MKSSGHPVRFRSGDTSDEAIAGVRAGLAFSIFERLAREYGIAPDTLAATIGVPPRTLARRKADGRFRADESDRLARFARVAARATETFESAAKAGRWLQTPIPVLAGESPLRLLDTDLGAVRVERILGRIDHGVFS